MIVIGADHSGIEIKNKLVSYLRSKGLLVEDVSNEVFSRSDDYPDIALRLTEKVLEDDKNFGIAICGTGIGISIACNKVKKIRAALCMDSYTAEMARRHNNANVICFGAKTSTCYDIEKVKEMVDVFLSCPFDGERHERRLRKIELIEAGKSLDLEGEE